MTTEPPLEILMFERACALAERQVSAASATPDAQTACTDWNANQLVNHMVAALQGNIAMFSGGEMSVDPWNPPAIAPSEMLDVFRATTAEAVQVVSEPGALERMIQHPAVPDPMPISAAVAFPTFDMYIHSWDLAHATGLEGDYPADLTDHVMGWSQMVFAGERAPNIVQDAVPAPDDATAIEQLVAFLGRPVPR